MSDLGVFDVIRWIAWMACISLCLLVLRALFHKPASVLSKRWLFLSTPELIQCAFTTTQMYGIAEKTAKTHIKRYGVGEWIDLYTSLFEAYAGDPTTDGYWVTGSITDLEDGRVSLIFNLKRGDESLEYRYTVSYIHLARVTDALSPALLTRLDWHKKTLNKVSEG